MASNDRAFIPVEEADAAIADVESMLQEAAPSGSRLTALAALLSVRVQLGLPIPDPSLRGALERLQEQEHARRRSHPGSRQVNRRTDGELSD